MKHWDVTDEQWIQVDDSRLDSNPLKLIVKDLSGVDPQTSIMLMSRDSAKAFAEDILKKVERLERKADKVSAKPSTKHTLIGLQFELDVRKAIVEGWRYLAIDKSGGMYLYMSKPYFTYSQWASSHCSSRSICKQVKKFSPDSVQNIWRSSLTELKSLI